MKNLELLKEKMNAQHCVNCNNVSNTLIAPSISNNKEYYVTCTKCGHVSVAKESFNKKGEANFIINATSTKEKESNKKIMMDAMASYEAIGFPVSKTFFSTKEAEEYVSYLEELKASSQEYDEEYDEEYECDTLIERMNNSKISLDESYNDMNTETYMVVSEEWCIRVNTYTVKNLNELQEKIEEDFEDTENIKIYKIEREVQVKRKLVLA